MAASPRLLPSRLRTRASLLLRRLLHAPTRAAVVERLAMPTRHASVVRLGDECGWWIPAEACDRPGVAYCVGAGEDITFDLALHELGYRVVTFDPTPRAMEYVGRVAPRDERFQFVPVGWWDKEADLKFYAPRDSSHVSHSILNLQATDEYFVAHVEPPFQLVRRLGDESVDLIKLDVEGAEHRILASLLARGPRPDVLCVEFDQPEPPLRTLGAVMRLRLAGYSLAHVDGWNYTFVRRSGRRSRG